VIQLDAKTTAVIVVDMWDKHYCKTYNRWADALVKRLNPALRRFREAQIPILFMTGDIASNHKDEPGYILLKHYAAQYTSPAVEVPHVPMDGWVDWYHSCPCKGESCWLDTSKPTPWQAIHPGVRRSPLDLIGDHTTHLGFLNKYGIKTLLYCGGAANVCVLDTRGLSLWPSKHRGFEPILLSDLVIPILPERSEREALTVVLDYYRNNNICPVVKSSNLVLKGKGSWYRV